MRLDGHYCWKRLGLLLLLYQWAMSDLLFVAKESGILGDRVLGICLRKGRKGLARMWKLRRISVRKGRIS